METKLFIEVWLNSLVPCLGREYVFQNILGNWGNVSFLLFLASSGLGFSFCWLFLFVACAVPFSQHSPYTGHCPNCLYTPRLFVSQTLTKVLAQWICLIRRSLNYSSIKIKWYYLGVVMCDQNPSIQEAETEGLPKVKHQTWLHSKSEASLGNLVRPCPPKIQKKKLNI